jgi:hypothetical protein
MSFTITVRHSAVWVEYLEKVDALDVIHRNKDVTFLEHLTQTRKVVFDYSKVKENRISQDDTRGIGVLARLQAEFIPNVHVILIPNDDESEAKAQYYSTILASTSWRVDIVRHVEEAVKLLTS